MPKAMLRYRSALRGTTLLEFMVGVGVLTMAMLMVLLMIMNMKENMRKEVVFSDQETRVTAALDALMQELRGGQNFSIVLNDGTTEATFYVPHLQPDTGAIQKDKVKLVWRLSPAEGGARNGDAHVKPDGLDNDQNGVIDDGVVWRHYWRYIPGVGLSAEPESSIVLAQVPYLAGQGFRIVLGGDKHTLDLFLTRVTDLRATTDQGTLTYATVHYTMNLRNPQE
ncbi:MAG: hypothetical protein HY291_19875 [Planctomycetes bacterium]|nr:hypothetical protein [Planctomycetota bacterium]